MASYSLSKEAIDDLDRLLDYGIDKFGLNATSSYFDGLYRHFSELADNPLQYQAVDHIRRGYRRSVYGSHSMYYIL